MLPTSLLWTLSLALGVAEKTPELPVPVTPQKSTPSPMLPGDRPGPDRPTVVTKDVRVRDAVPDELVYDPKGPAPQQTSLFMLSYRSFAIKDHLARHQNWHVLGVEIAPLRNYFRLSLITEAGIEGGEAAQNGDRGDFFVMQKLGLGVQYPHWVTPFVEFQGGAGIGRVEMYERNDLGIFWSLGLDVGAQWSLARRLRLMAAAGWIRPTIKRYGEENADAVYFNRGSFKVGLGF